MNFIALILGLITFAFFGFSSFDQWATLSDHRPYLDMLGAEAETQSMIAWAQGLPLWRQVMWGVTNAAGLLGGLFLLLRQGAGSVFLWLAALVAAAGLGGDYALLGGVEAVGEGYFMFGGGMIGVTVVMAIVAGLLARR